MLENLNRPGNYSSKNALWLKNTCNSCSRPLCSGPRKYFGKHKVVENAPETDALTTDEAGFIASRDSFYVATVSETGWPYVQHRGGPPGFVKVLGPDLIGFADFKGNCQLVSTGNLDVTDRVALFMMDYPQRTRLKLLGHARVLDAREHPELVDQLGPESLRSKVQR